jgi:ABC-type branched-subunit amino acid transport system substrate-binding protein/TolA-binding protein
MINTAIAARLYLHLIIAFAGLWVLSACAPVEWYPEPAPEVSPETAQALDRFQAAERFFDQGAYQEALSIYRNYLSEYPEGPLRDRAWLQTGIAYLALDQYEQGAEAFRHILSAHPRSSLVPEASYRLALAYYKDKRYEWAIRQGKSALEVAQSKLERFQARYLLGQAHTAVQEFDSALVNYAAAYNLAPPERQPDVLSNIKEGIAFLEIEELERLVERFRKRAPGGYLHLQLARQYALYGRIESALEVLSDFFKRYPNHRERSAALALREELKSRALVDRFLIGCILPLSGPYAAFGERALTGIELALDLFNAQVHTHPVQLAVRDSKGNPNDAVAALKALVQNEGVIGVIGPMITSESVALEAQALKVPIVTLTQKSGIPSVGDYVFRNFLTPSSQVETIIHYAVHDLGFRRFAVLYPDEPYGISFMNRFWDELIRFGAELVGVESYLPEQTDFNEEIRKLVGLYYPRPEPEDRAWPTGEAEIWSTLWNLHMTFVQPEEAEASEDAKRILQTEDPEEKEEDKSPEPIIDFEAIFIPDSYGKVGLITPQLLYHGVEDVLLLGSNLWHSPKLIEMAQEYVQGAVIAEGFFAESPLPRVVNFVKNYQSVFQRSPGYLEAQAYDTAWILCQATNNPKTASRMTLRSTLAAIAGFPGVTGTTSFDENGDVRKETYLLQIQGKRFIQIRP